MFVLAIDLGASSGRGIVYSLKDNEFVGSEVHRFSNDPVMINGRFRWDILRIFFEIKQCILKAHQQGYTITSVGIDTWGVDYGLIKKNGDLYNNPFHYRDTRTAGIINNYNLLSKKHLYDIAGIGLNEFNTTYQLTKERDEHLFYDISTLLFIPNLLGYFLTGVKKTEPTIASTSGFYTRKEGFSKEFLSLIGVESSIMPTVAETGEILGKISRSILEELGIDYDINVVLTAGHDTACAVASVPSSEENVLYSSSGTWSLFGTELDEPNKSDIAFEENYTNELGVKKVRFLKSLMGLWIIQECKRDWHKKGIDKTFDEIEEMASSGTPFKALINYGDNYFNPPYRMSDRIIKYVADTQKVTIEGVSEVARCVFESLALEYKHSLVGLMKITGKSYKKLHIVGGGAKSVYLNQMIADCLGIEVVAGPGEATSIGNAMLQLMSCGAIASIETGKEIVGKMKEIVSYQPKNTKVWADAYDRYVKLKG